MISSIANESLRFFSSSTEFRNFITLSSVCFVFSSAIMLCFYKYKYVLVFALFIIYIAYDFHFASSSRLSLTRNFVILLIKDKGRGLSNGNRTDPLAVENFERFLAKAFTADGVG